LSDLTGIRTSGISLFVALLLLLPVYRELLKHQCIAINQSINQSINLFCHILKSNCRHI